MEHLSRNISTISLIFIWCCEIIYCKVSESGLLSIKNTLLVTLLNLLEKTCAIAS